jgi:poly-gamma-glutamate synthesis protein (capsule biosynthesis protein)
VLWVAPYIPDVLSEALALPAGYGMADTPQDALVRFEIGDRNPRVTWVYALVAPFFTLADSISSQDLVRAWKGENGSEIAGLPILVDARTLGAFTELWGEPSQGSVQVVPSEELADFAWNQQTSWAIIPFEDVEPRWKVLEVDGKSPLRKEFDPNGYALSVSYSLDGDPELVEKLLLLSESEGDGLVLTNWEASKLSTLVMTGVTAMVRCTANTMERKGITYPAEDVGTWLREADLTHISNEIPFMQGCPFPNCTQPDLRFCSDPSYIALLENVGADIIELTGDHFADYGPDAMRYTLQLYRDRDWTYYGGGENWSDARQARTLEHNGNRIAIIGCNAKGGGYATASDTNPGAVACDYEWMHGEIARLSEEGYIVIATFQHIEYYTYAPQPKQLEDYGGMAAAGAVIVSGSQAHQPQGFEITGNSFIHYGLGNLFFDQFNQPVCPNLSCNDAFIDRHVFYDGRYISTELLTITFVDFAKPRPMTSEERVHLLTKVFEASVR